MEAGRAAKAEVVSSSKWFEFLAGCDEPTFRRACPTFRQAAKDTVAHLPGYMLELENSKTGEVWGAGKLSVLSIGDLEKIAEGLPNIAREPGAKMPEVEFIAYERSSASARLDVAALQADPENAHAVFQAASNFNAVEAVSSGHSPAGSNFTSNYVFDKTQGPAASVSAGAAAIARVHAAFFDPCVADGNVDAWRQTSQRQVELLGNLRQYFAVRNGYVVKNTKEQGPLPSEPDKLRALVRVALHSDAQVTFGADTGTMPVVRTGHVIDQVFCAAINCAQFSESAEEASAERRRLLLHGAYDGTYLAAIVNRRKTVFLTLVGGGVFDNPMGDIYDAICAAHVKYASHGASEIASVKVNLRNSEPPVDLVKKLKAAGIPVRFTVWEDVSKSRTVSL